MTSVSSLFSLQLRHEESHLADKAGNLLVMKSKGFSRRKMDYICKGALWNCKDNDETLHWVASPILGMVTTIWRVLWSSVSKHTLSIASHCSLTTTRRNRCGVVRWSHPFYRWRRWGSALWSVQDHTTGQWYSHINSYLWFLNFTLQQWTFCRAFSSFQGISDMQSILQPRVQCVLLFTSEKIEFQSICITCLDNIAHKWA